MTDSEMHIMRHFRQYRVKMNEMLFFNTGLAKSHPPRFHVAMASLIRNGLVVAERPRDAYSLTLRGYSASITA